MAKERLLGAERTVAGHEGGKRWAGRTLSIPFDVRGGVAVAKWQELGGIVGDAISMWVSGMAIWSDSAFEVRVEGGDGFGEAREANRPCVT